MGRFKTCSTLMLLLTAFQSIPALAAMNIQECKDYCRGTIDCWQYKNCQQECSNIERVPEALNKAKDTCAQQLNVELSSAFLKQNEAIEKGRTSEINMYAKKIADIKDILKTMMMGNVAVAGSAPAMSVDNDDMASGRWLDRMSAAGQAYFAKNYSNIREGELCHPDAKWPPFKLSIADEKIRIQICEERKRQKAKKLKAYYDSKNYWNGRKIAIEQKSREEERIKESLAKTSKLSPSEFEADYQRRQEERRAKELALEALEDKKEIFNERNYFEPRASQIRKQAEFDHAQRELAEHKAAQEEIAKNRASQSERDKVMQEHKSMMSEKLKTVPDVNLRWQK